MLPYDGIEAGAFTSYMIFQLDYFQLMDAAPSLIFDLTLIYPIGLCKAEELMSL